MRSNMSDNNSGLSEYSDYKLHYTGTDLDDKDYFCTENFHAEKEFVGDSKDYDLLSANPPKLSGWKETNTHIIVGFNQATKEMHDQSRKN